MEKKVTYSNYLFWY